jgi:hypothetical protein
LNRRWTLPPLAAAFEGVTSSASVVQSGTTYSVVGSHTYNREDTYTITVTVAEEGVSAAATSSAVIGEAGLPPGAPSGRLASFINETLDDAFNQQPTGAQISNVEAALLVLEFQLAEDLISKGDSALQAFLTGYVLGQVEFGLYVGVLSRNNGSLNSSVNDMVGAFLLQAVDIGATGAIRTAL